MNQSGPHIPTVTRWVWSQLENVPGFGWRPVAREYTLEYIAPQHFDCRGKGGWALCKCTMLYDHFEAAQQDPRVIILGDLNSPEVIPSDMAIALGPKFGVALTDTVRGALNKMATFNQNYLPEH